MVTVNEQHHERARTAAQYTAENPTLTRELALESDTGHFKFGSGAYNSLPYADASSLPELAVSDPGKVPVTTTGTAPNQTTTLDVDGLAELADLTGLWPPVVARLTADLTPVNNSVVLVDATGLAVALAASAVYHIRQLLFFSGTATSDLAAAWSTPAGATGRFGSGGPSATAAYEATSRLWSETLPVGASGTGANHNMLDMAGIIITTSAGTLQFRYAQNTAEVANTTIRAFSTLIATRIT